MPAVLKFIATFGFTGFFPVAPATFASAIFCLIYYYVPGGEWLAHPLVCLATLIVSVPVSGWMEKDYGEDPGCVVIDEVVGMQVVLVGVSGLGLGGLVLAFLFFRLFDIVKPYPVGRSQRFPGGWGIVIDDVLAGVYARIVMLILAWIWPSLGAFGF